MTSHHSDILLPRAAWGSTTDRSRMIAFVPIMVALLGVAGILLGGISVQTINAHNAAFADIDPVATGSIASGGSLALPMLDR